MNNLILAVIAVAFSALIMTAGIAYITPVHAVLNTEATNSMIEIDQLLTDYNNLRMTVGGTLPPSVDDYLAVYGNAGAASTAANTLNASYALGTDANGNRTVSRSSFLQDIPSVKDGVSGWVFISGCNGLKDANNMPVDCFQLQIDNAKMNDPAAATTTCEALTLAQKHMQGSSYAMVMQNADNTQHTCN